VLALLQSGLPLCEHPYIVLSEKSGLPEAEVLKIVQSLKDSGIIRRLGAFVQHRTLGLSANGMCVFEVSEDRLDDLGAKLAAKKNISHCYARVPALGWPFNLYGMMHGNSREIVIAEADNFAKSEDIRNHRVLFSTREFKKTGTRILLEDK
jgi:DNA-binding Lrp family transcriptional regulator